jgi:WD40 repeat protein
VAAFSADGQTVVTGGPGQRLGVWDVATGRLLVRGTTYLGIARPAITPDGRRVATADRNGVTIWDVPSGRTHAVPIAEDGPRFASALAFAADGGQLAVVAQGQSTQPARVLLVSVPDGRELRRWDGLPGRVEELALAPDGGTATALTACFAAVHLDLRADRPPRTVPLLPEGSVNVTARRLAPDGRRAAFAQWNGATTMFDTQSGQPLWVIPRSSIPALDFTADGRTLAVLEWGRRSATVALLDGATGRRLRAFVLPEQPLQRQTALRLTPDGRRAAVTFFSRTALSLWDTETGRPVPVPDGHVTSVYKLAAAADGRWAVSCAGRELRCWDLTDGRLRWQTEGEFSLSGVAIPPGGRTVLTCRMDGQVDEREATTGRPIRTVAAGIPGESVIGSFTVAADGRSAYVRRHYHGFDKTDLDVIGLRPGAGPARRISLSQVGRVTTVTPDGR